MNVRLLRKIQKHISEEPRRFAMRSWVQRPGFHGDAVFDTGGHRHEFPQCGTAACIGGWAVILHDKKRIANTPQVSKRAKRLLELTDFQAASLFDVWSWPAKFHNAFRNSKTPARRVKVAVERIEHFIKTKGAE